MMTFVVSRELGRNWTFRTQAHFMCLVPCFRHSHLAAGEVLTQNGNDRTSSLYYMSTFCFGNIY